MEENLKRNRSHDCAVEEFRLKRWKDNSLDRLEQSFEYLIGDLANNMK